MRGMGPVEAVLSPDRFSAGRLLGDGLNRPAWNSRGFDFLSSAIGHVAMSYPYATCAIASTLSGREVPEG